MYEVVQSTTHMGIFEEALNAKYFGVGKPYGKAEQQQTRKRGRRKAKKGKEREETSAPG